MEAARVLQHPLYTALAPALSLMEANEVFRTSILFNFQLLLHMEVVTPLGFPTPFAGLVAHFPDESVSGFILFHLLRTGTLHAIAKQPGIDLEKDRRLMVIFCYLFFRQHVKQSDQFNLLPPISEKAKAAIIDWNEMLVKLLLSIATVPANNPEALPLSPHLALPKSTNGFAASHPLLAPFSDTPVSRDLLSSFQFDSVLHGLHAHLPWVDLIRQVPLFAMSNLTSTSRYLYDFYDKELTVAALCDQYGISNTIIWPMLQGFKLLLRDLARSFYMMMSGMPVLSLDEIPKEMLESETVGGRDVKLA